MEHGDDVTRMMSSKKMAQAPINIKKNSFFCVPSSEQSKSNGRFQTKTDDNAN